jgi:hypothetical protein
VQQGVQEGGRGGERSGEQRGQGGGPPARAPVGQQWGGGLPSCTPHSGTIGLPHLTLSPCPCPSPTQPPPPPPSPPPHTPKGADHIREKDGIFAVLCWLSILAYKNKGTAPGSKLVTVAEVAEEFWKEYGRNFFRCLGGGDVGTLSRASLTQPAGLAPPFLAEARRGCLSFDGQYA